MADPMPPYQIIETSRRDPRTNHGFLCFARVCDVVICEVRGCSEVILRHSWVQARKTEPGEQINRARDVPKVASEVCFKCAARVFEANRGVA